MGRHAYRVRACLLDHDPANIHNAARAFPQPGMNTAARSCRAPDAPSARAPPPPRPCRKRDRRWAGKRARSPFRARPRQGRSRSGPAHGNLRIHACLEAAGLALGGVLGAGEGKVGPAYQVRGGEAGLTTRIADRGADRDLMPIHILRPVQAAAMLLMAASSAASSTRRGNTNDELVAAEPPAISARKLLANRRSRPATQTSKASPALWPRMSLIGLNPSRSSRTTAVNPSRDRLSSSAASAA